MNTIDLGDWKNIKVGDIVFSSYRGYRSGLSEAKVVRIESDKENPDLPPKSIEVIGSFGLSYDEPLADGTESVLKVYFFRSIKEVNSRHSYVDYSSQIVDQLWIDPSSDREEVGVETYYLYTQEAIKSWWEDPILASSDALNKIAEKFGWTPRNQKAIAEK